MEEKYYSVTQYNTAIKNFLDSKVECQNVHIKGEISNYKGHTRGHLYFTLKDEKSRINAVMFSFNTGNLNFIPKDGDEVLVDGKISCYIPNGDYQVYVENMRLDGDGELLKKFEELKKKLQQEGLFDSNLEKIGARPIPRYPTRIGIVTAPTGAAIKDILSTIKRRFPLCETILFPSLVQGEEAKFEIVKQIEMAQNYDLDTLIVGRGGGSIEDLWAFNEEMVARAIYESRIPVISGVGHEPDWTIADMVADLRAPTPTGAAEKAVPNMTDVLNDLANKKIRLTRSIINRLDYYQKYLDNLKCRKVLTNPLSAFEIKEQLLDTYIDRFNIYIKHTLEIANNKLETIKKARILINPQDIFINKNNTLELLINKLELLNPIGVLKKGYSVTKKGNKILSSVKDVKKDDILEIKLSDGKINTIVKGVN